MRQRVVLGGVTILLLLGAVLTDLGIALRLSGVEGPFAALFRRGSVIPLMVLLFSLFGARELVRLLRLKNADPHSRFSYLMIVFLVLSPWLASAGWLGGRASQVEGLYWPVAGLVISVIGTGACTVFRRNPNGALFNAASTLLVILYLGFATSFAIQIRCARGITGPSGAWLLLMLLLVTKSADIGGYFAGTAWGRHKLIPSVSPGKTVEGTIGAVLASGLVAMMFASSSSWLGSLRGWLSGVNSAENTVGAVWHLILEAARSMNLAPRELGLDSASRGFLLGVTLAVVGQIGDLFESCFKRDCGTKDSGNVIPKFGGILDLIDSPVLAMPVAWLMLTAVWGLL